MPLKSLQPNPAWDRESHESIVDAFEVLAADGSVEIHVWGGDWCGDTRRELPNVGATLEAAEFPDERLHVHEVDGEKQGDLVGVYDVELIPTIVIEREGEELVRFAESERLPAPAYLATALREAGVVA
ncbi:MAG: thioredoxin domain-containing protein [Halobacteriales archaeon]